MHLCVDVICLRQNMAMLLEDYLIIVKLWELSVNKSHVVVPMSSLSHQEKRIDRFQFLSPYHETITRLLKLILFSCFHNPSWWRWSLYRVSKHMYLFKAEELSIFWQFQKLSSQRVIILTAAETGLYMAMPSCYLQINLSFCNYESLVDILLSFIWYVITISDN